MMSESNTMKAATGHKQIKVLVDIEIADSFKAACKKSGVSMASEISQFMARYSKTAMRRKPSTIEDSSTRAKRRKIIAHVIRLMELARDGEDVYRENMPINLHNSTMYESSEESSSAMEQAIDILESVYQ